MLRELGVEFSGVKPPVVEIKSVYGRQVVLSYREYIRDGEPHLDDSNPTYIYDVYTIKVDDDNRFYKMSEDQLKSKILELCYNREAENVRKIRNSLLEESDKYMTLDKGLNLGDISANLTATNMLSTLRTLITSLLEAVNGDVAIYRKKLRDLPEQEGFPYDVDYPTKPISIK